MIRYAFKGNALEMKGILTENAGVDLSETKAYEWNIPKARELLEDAGYLVYDKPRGDPKRRIKWSKTRAVCQRTCHIYLNVKGRDPQGIVKPGKEYEKVREEIIDLLYTYRDPKTRNRPVILALRREDARMLGHFTERSGDIVYALRDDYSGLAHGYQLPTAESGEGQQRALLVMAGPGIKKNYALERTMNIIDIVPTVCHLVDDLPLPCDVDGAIVYQALERP